MKFNRTSLFVAALLLGATYASKDAVVTGKEIKVGETKEREGLLKEAGQEHIEEKKEDKAACAEAVGAKDEWAGETDEERIAREKEAKS
jgi:hypothetical protein